MGLKNVYLTSEMKVGGHSNRLMIENMLYEKYVLNRCKNQLGKISNANKYHCKYSNSAVIYQGVINPGEPFFLAGNNQVYNKHTPLGIPFHSLPLFPHANAFSACKVCIYLLF